MNLNPVIIIPSYWGNRRKRSNSEFENFPNVTPIDKESPLKDCLNSLSKLEDCPPIIILVSAPERVDTLAYDKVIEITKKYSRLKTIVIGPGEISLLHLKMSEGNYGKLVGCVGNFSQGSVKNLGIAVASIFGFDTLIFLDETKVIYQKDFIGRAIYGLGLEAPTGDIVAAKTGIYIDKNNSYKFNENDPKYLSTWNEFKDINFILDEAVKQSRLSLAKTAFGGCMVLHAEVFSHVAFDPWVCQSEAQDFVLSAHMYGSSVWFDNKFSVMNNSDISTYKDKPQDLQISNFKASILHWFYETRKIEFSKTQIDLLQIDMQEYSPYPGNWISKKLKSKVLTATIKSGINASSKSAFVEIITKSQSSASKYARHNCSKYFELQSYWTDFIHAFWNNKPLAAQFRSSSSSSSARATTNFNPAG